MSPARREIIQPHPLMPDLYRDNQQKHQWLRAIFNETAGDYDRVESWLSLGSGRWYRRQALKRAGLASGMSVADVACGTGLVAREAMAIIGPAGKVIGVDPSQGMLAEAQRLAGIQTMIGFAEHLPLEDGAFDFLSMGYALRHLEDLGPAFAEFHRVLKPGGRICILEITRPEGGAGRGLLRGYMKLLAWLIRFFKPRSRRTGELWDYYWRTIDQCVRPGIVIQALIDAGFEEVEHRAELGIFSEYTGRRGDKRVEG